MVVAPKRALAGDGAKQHCFCPTIGARVVATRSGSIRGNQFIKTFRAALAFAGAAAWDKLRSRYNVQLHPLAVITLFPLSKRPRAVEPASFVQG